MLYEIKVKYNALDEKGKEKEITEQYLFDCELHAEAECKGMEINNGNCDVTAVKRSRIIEVINEGDETYYKAKVIDIFVDDKGKEKENPYYLLCNAKTVEGATKLVNEHLKQGMQDFRLGSVTETKILEILK